MATDVFADNDVTVQELFEYLKGLVDSGKGNYKVFYDAFCAGITIGGIYVSDDGKAISLS